MALAMTPQQQRDFEEKGFIILDDFFSPTEVAYLATAADEVAERVQKAKGLGAMPNISHMIELASADDIDDEVLQLTDTAFDIVHS